MYEDTTETGRRKKKHYTRWGKIETEKYERTNEMLRYCLSFKVF